MTMGRKRASRSAPRPAGVVIVRAKSAAQARSAAIKAEKATRLKGARLGGARLGSVTTTHRNNARMASSQVTQISLLAIDAAKRGDCGGAFTNIAEATFWAGYGEAQATSAGRNGGSLPAPLRKARTVFRKACPLPRK